MGNLEKRFEKIINTLKINTSLKNYIILGQEPKNICKSESEKNNWDKFFQDIRLRIDRQKLCDTIIYEIKYILQFEYCIFFYKEGCILKISQFLKYLYNRLRDKLEENISKLINLIFEILCINFEIKKVELQLAKRKIIANCIILKEPEINYIKTINVNEYEKNFIYINKKPVKWSFLDEKNVILENPEMKLAMTTLGKYIQDSHIKSLFTQELINYINILQDIQYKIDKNLFINLYSKFNLKDFYKDKKTYIVIDYYEKFLLDNMDSYIASNDIKDINRFLQVISSLEYSNKNLKRKKVDSKVLSNRINQIDKEVLNFIFNYNPDNWLSNNYFMDYRGRLYILGNISYISSKLLRSLIILDEKKKIQINDYFKYYIACQLDNPISIKQGVEIYKNRRNYKKNRNIQYHKIKTFKVGYISLDATASMMQIIGVLSKNKKLLQYTNLVNSDQRYDIYDYILSKICDPIYREDFFNKEMSKTKKTANQLEIDFNKFEKKIEIFKKFFKTRKIYKYCIMLYVYGSTPLFTAKSYKLIYKVNNIHSKDLTFIMNYILKVFKKEFPSVPYIKQFIKIYADLTKYEKYYQFNTLLKKLEYSCPKDKEIKMIYNKIYTSFLVSSDLDSYKKKLKSSFVNIIHSLDSEICILTRVLLLKKYSIKSLSVHDCFIVHINDYEKCLECYNESIGKLFSLDLDEIINNTYIVDKEKFLDIWYKKYVKYTENDGFLIDIYIRSQKIKKSIDGKNLQASIIRKDTDKMKDIYSYLSKFIINNYTRYIRNKEELQKLKDFKVTDFDFRKIKYSLKPE